MNSFQMTEAMIGNFLTPTKTDRVDAAQMTEAIIGDILTIIKMDRMNAS